MMAAHPVLWTSKKKSAPVDRNFISQSTGLFGSWQAISISDDGKNLENFSVHLTVTATNSPESYAIDVKIRNTLHTVITRANGTWASNGVISTKMAVSHSESVIEQVMSSLLQEIKRFELEGDVLVISSETKIAKFKRAAPTSPEPSRESPFAKFH